VRLLGERLSCAGSGEGVKRKRGNCCTGRCAPNYGHDLRSPRGLGVACPSQLAARRYNLCFFTCPYALGYIASPVPRAEFGNALPIQDLLAPKWWFSTEYLRIFRVTTPLLAVKSMSYRRKCPTFGRALCPCFFRFHTYSGFVRHFLTSFCGVSPGSITRCPRPDADKAFPFCGLALSRTLLVFGLGT